MGDIFWFVRQLLGTKYVTAPDDSNALQFYASNGPPPSVTYVREHGVDCLGLVNLFFRSNEIKVYPIGLAKWPEHYSLIPMQQTTDMAYPSGTILMAPFKSDEEDPGHVAIVYHNNIILHAWKNDVHFGDLHSGHPDGVNWNDYFKFFIFPWGIGL